MPAPAPSDDYREREDQYASPAPPPRQDDHDGDAEQEEHDGEEFSVQVQWVADGKTTDATQLFVRPSETVASIKRRIASEHGAEPQKMVFRGKQLEDGKSLRDYSVREGAKLIAIRTKVHEEAPRSASREPDRDQAPPAPSAAATRGGGRGHPEDLDEDDKASDHGDNKSHAPSPAGEKAVQRAVAGNVGEGEGADGARESERLKVMVKSFVAKALKGSPCTCFAMGERVKTYYVVDKSLRNLIVLDMAGSSGRQIVCPIMAIVDIYTVGDDGMDVFPPEVATNLKPAERELLFMVVFRDLNKLYRFCLLEESLDGRVMFAEAMKILRHYVQPAIDRPRGVGVKVGLGQDSQQASVGFFLRSVGVQGGRGAAGLLRPGTRKLAMSPLPECGAVTYLSSYGYRAASEAFWRVSPGTPGMSGPLLQIRVTQHIEASRHTWYMIECTLVMEGDFGVMPPIDWLAPRRLLHLRRDLHDRVERSLGPLYTSVFDFGRHFAKRGGLPGTTAQLNKWCSALCDCINAGTAAPEVVAMVLWFLEAPAPDALADTKMITDGVDAG